MPQVVVIGGTNSGVGKTSFTLGLIAVLRRRGLVVQSFKVGPDFVDPLHHAAVSSRPCINLDGWLLDKEAVLSSFWNAAAGCDVAVVEGAMGLFDGAEDSSENGSTAQIAKWLHAPVILIIDCSTIARSIAAVIKGCQSFDPALSIPGVVLNKATSPMHAKSLSNAIDAANLGLTVLGGMLKGDLHDGMEGSDRSTMSGPSIDLPPGHITMLADAVEAHVQVDRLLELVATLSPPPPPPSPPLACPRIRLGLASDNAFCYYHEQNLLLLEAAGFDLVRFSPMEDPLLPEGVAALYFGGGHPEHFCAALSSNGSMLVSVRAFCEAGGVVYAEAAGLMYLSQSIQLPSRVTCPMAGVFSFRTRVTTDEAQVGYATVTASASCPIFPAGAQLRGHYHHHSEIVEEHILAGLHGAAAAAARGTQPRHQYSYTAAIAGPGGVEVPEGYTYKSVLASYVHLQLASAPPAVAHFAARCAAVDAGAVHGDVAAVLHRWQLQQHHHAPAQAAHHARQPSGGGAFDRLHAHTLSESASMCDLLSGGGTPMTRSPTPSDDNLMRLLSSAHAASCGDLLSASANGSCPQGYYLPALAMPARGRSADALAPNGAQFHLQHHHLPGAHHPHPDDASRSSSPERHPPPSLPALKTVRNSFSDSASLKMSDPPAAKSPDSSTATQLTPSKLQPQTHTKLIGIACPLTRPPKPPLAPPPLPPAADHIQRSQSACTLSSGGSSTPFSWQHHPQAPPHLARPSLDSPMSRRSSNGTNDFIVSFSPPSTEALLAMGLGGRLIGITDRCDCPVDPRMPRCRVSAMEAGPLRSWWLSHSLVSGQEGGAQGLQGQGGGAACFTVDEDFLRDEQPGLVVMQDPGGCYCPGKEAVQKALQRAGLLRAESSTCILQLRCHSLSDVLESLLTLGRAASAVEAAQQLTDRLRSRLRKVAGAAALHPTNLRVLCLVSLQPLVAGGAWISEMLALAGATDIQTDPCSCPSSTAPHPKDLTWDDIRHLAPDVLLICHPYQGTEQTLAQVAQLAGLPGWWNLPAVRDGQVYVLHPSLAARPGPRLVDGVEVMTRILHPGLATKRAPPGMVLRLSLQGGQRCRQKLLPNYFLPLV